MLSHHALVTCFTEGIFAERSYNESLFFMFMFILLLFYVISFCLNNSLFYLLVLLCGMAKTS